MSTFDAGAIKSTLTLDRSPFVRDLKAAREQARRFTKDPIKIPLAADRTPLTRDLKNAREQIRRLTKQKFEFNITANVDTAGATANLERFKKTTVNSLNRDKPVVNVDADTAAAATKLGFLKAETNSLDHDRVVINVDADTAPARRQIGLLQGQMLGSRSGVALLIGSLVSIAPAAVPVLAATTGGVLALGSALTAAAGGAAILGAGVVGNFMKMKALTDQVTKAQEKLRLATNPADRKKAATELAQAQAKIAGTTGGMGVAARAMLALDKAWNTFLQHTSGDAFGLITQGLRMLTGIIPRVTPLFHTFAVIAGGALDTIAGWVKSPAFTQFLNFFKTLGAQAMKGFIQIAFNLADVVLQLIYAFAPLGRIVVGALVKMTKSWAQWANGLAKSQGFKDFIDYVKQNGPATASLISNLVGFALNLVKALAPLGVLILNLLNPALKFLATMNPTVLGAIATGILAIVGAVTLLNGIMGVFKALSAISGGWVTLLIIGIAALAAGLIYAYKNSETFRNIVNGAFAAVKSFVMGVAAWFSGPFVNFFITAWNKVSGGAQAMWARVMGVFNAFKAAFQAVAGLVSAVWNGWIGPIFQLIGAVIHKVLGIEALIWMTAFKVAWMVLATQARGIWDGVLHPVFNALAAIIRWLYNSVAKPIFGYIWSQFKTLATNLKWDYDHTIGPMIRFFGNHIKDLGGIFKWAVREIGHQWNMLEGIAKKPIKFVIGTVINDALIGGFNKLADVFGTKHMSKIPLPFSTGGMIPGFSPTPTADNIPILATANEFMVRQKSTKKLQRNNPGALEYINETGQLPPQYGIGGWIGNAAHTVGGAVSGAYNWTKDLASSLNPVALIKRAVNGLLNRLGGSNFADMAKGGAKTVLNDAIAWAKKQVFGGASGPHMQGNYRSLEALVASAVPGSVVTSDFRPGARTRYGNLSQHALGKAVDWAPTKSLWDFLFPRRGQLFELLGPWGMYRGGKPYHDPALQAMHENHIHASVYGQGGLIKPPTFDRGGTVSPGLNLINNKLGRPESLAPTDALAAQNDQLLKVLDAVLQELRRPKRVALTPDGQRSFEAVLEDAAEGSKAKVVRQVYAGRKG